VLEVAECELAHLRLRNPESYSKTQREERAIFGQMMDKNKVFLHNRRDLSLFNTFFHANDVSTSYVMT
jgi:hypothetical protein